VLSGGAVVSIYSRNEYESGDWNDLQSLDQAVMVATRQKVSIAALEAWARKEGMAEKIRAFKERLGKGK
jgi:hypothetical protein